MRKIAGNQARQLTPCQHGGMKVRHQTQGETLPELLIPRFMKLSEALSEAIARDDEERIMFLDRELQAAFEDLLRSEPNTKEGKTLLAGFLIEYIGGGFEQTELQNRAKEKLLSLID